MDALFSKEWWQILLILITSAGSIGFLLYAIIKLNGFIKVGDWSFGGPKIKIAPSKHTEYLEFCMIFKELNIQIKNKFRQYCLENGMENINGQDWVDYKNHRMDQIGKMAYQFMTEHYAGKKIVELEDLIGYKQNQRDDAMLDVLSLETNKLFDTLKELTENTNDLVIQKNLELVNYMDIKIRNVDAEISTGSIIEVVMNCGKRMVEIHELKNRELLRKQMIKAEETMLQIYADITIRYLSLLQTKLNK